MKVGLLLLFGVCLGQDINNRKFPSDFLFGVSTSAYQIEGAWNEDGKTVNNWDVTLHNTPNYTLDSQNGDVACDSYHKYKDDIAILKELGVTHYRFSLAWTRILPNGYDEGEDLVNEAGVQYYKNLIQELKSNGIEPVITLFHSELPQNLYEMGGFLNDSIVEWYSKFTRACFKYLGDDVKYWITINEPQQVCTGGYGYGYNLPNIKSEGLLEYQCIYNLLKAHAKAWHIYDEEFRPTQNGQITITLDTYSFVPASDSDEDRDAADRMQHFTMGVYANPIFNGDYPEVVKTRVAERSRAEGRSQSRLPELSEEEVAYIKGTGDFFALNVYSGMLVSALGYDPPVTDPPTKWGDQAINNYQPSEWENTTVEYTKVVPWTGRYLLNWIQNTYNNPRIFMTENGYPSHGNENDDRRIYYLRGYLSAIRDAMVEDNVPVFGYTIWSFMDNFEWSSGYTSADDINNKIFPDDFLFGVATSAYQVEGAWNDEGKGENIWDHVVHTDPGFILDGQNGNIACDSYNKYEVDVAMLKELGVNHYRFSLSWTRILPTGYSNEINVAGVRYYQNLIQELKANGIEPLVTIFHWDLPQGFQAMGGFLNESIVDWYSDYARIAFSLFGDDVKYWITINEPQQVCTGGYGYGYFPPSIKSEGLLEYQCVHNLIKAHAKAWHIYDEEFRPTQQGKISITLDTSAYLPASESEVDQEAAERMQQFTLGIYANPIYVGNYPEIVKSRVAERSNLEGRNQSRLPEFTDEEIAYIKGTHDFFGLNVYTAYLISDLGYEPPAQDPPNKWADQRINGEQPATWENTSSSYTKVVPWSVRPLLNWIKDHYDNPGIIITENGYPSYGNDNDDRRLSYIQGYLSAIRDTMENDDVSVLGYTVWSLMDNFEWTSGYTQKYGLYEVDFNDNDRTRTPRSSALYYKKVTATRCLVDECVN